VPQSVTLVSWGKELEVGLRLLLRQERQLKVISSPVELAKGIPPADVVVVDVPAQDRRAVCEQVRRHYRGRLIVLLDPGDSSHDLSPHPNRTLLSRPFFVYELSAALAGSGPTQPTPDPANQPPPVLPPKTLARSAKSRLGSCRSAIARVVPGLIQSWRERRLVRLSAISVPALLLVMAVFVLITQGTGCGPACDELTGADLTVPTTRPATTASDAGLVGPTTTDSSVDPTTNGRSRVDPATSSGPGIATTTAGSSATPGPSSPPDPTQPPPTAASTTAPTTTSPTPSTTTTTTTSTTTTTTRPRSPAH
jgi:hypothetical protein